jgi:hypothetical protein
VFGVPLGGVDPFVVNFDVQINRMESGLTICSEWMSLDERLSFGHLLCTCQKRHTSRNTDQTCRRLTPVRQHYVPALTHGQFRINATLFTSILLPSRKSSIPVTRRGDLERCEMLRISHCIDNRLTDGGKV